MHSSRASNTRFMWFWAVLVIAGVLLVMAWIANALQVPPAGQVLIVLGGIVIVAAGFVQQGRAWRNHSWDQQRALLHGSSDPGDSHLTRLDDARRRRAEGAAPRTGGTPESSRAARRESAAGS